MAYPTTTGISPTPPGAAGPPEDPTKWAPNKLNIWDSITFYGANQMGVTLPLASPPEGGMARDIDKKKSPGNDFARITDKGYDIVPVKITLLLWQDNWYDVDYIARYDSIRDQLMPKSLAARNAVSLYHPSLNAEGIQAILISKRGNLVHQGKQFFRVELEGYDVRNFVTKNVTNTAKKKGQNPIESNNIGIKTPTSQRANVTDFPSALVPVGSGSVLLTPEQLQQRGLPVSPVAGPAARQRGKV